LNGSGALTITGPGTLTLTGENTNTGAITVNGGNLLATGGGWYESRGIGSGALTVSNGAVAEFTQAHGFGENNYGEPATLNGGTLQFDLENYVSSLTMTAGTVTGAGEIRTTGGTYATLASSSPSVINVNVNFVSAGNFNVARGTGVVDLQDSGPASNTGNFTKSGNGIMAIGGVWANTGTTTINAGTLQVDGSLGTNTVTVASGATLSGAGIINGPATVQSGGTLAPGDNAPGTLTFAGALNLNSGSKTLMAVTAGSSAPTNSLVNVAGTLTCGGTLTVTNLGGAYAAGEKFTLFSAGAQTGNFSTVNLPALGGGLGWSNSLAVKGSIQVVTVVNLNPTNLTASVSSSGLTLSWPPDHTGWRLLAQTNHLSAGLSSNTNDWGTVAGSAATNNVILSIDPTKPAEFYKLVYP
jgi:autotransporter-associated beta strand protein